MQDTSGDSTLEAKDYFERDCMTQNVVSKHCYADNVKYAENTFKQDCESKMQDLTFYGVVALQKNGVSERIIKDLTLSLRNLVIYSHAIGQNTLLTCFVHFLWLNLQI